MKPELRKYARVAWTFLNTAGYINFGVAPDIAAKALKTPATRGTVIIVGAGLAGNVPGTIMRCAYNGAFQLSFQHLDLPCQNFAFAVIYITAAALQASLLRASCAVLAFKWLYLRDMAGLEAGCTPSALRCAHEQLIGKALMEY